MTKNYGENILQTKAYLKRSNVGSTKSERDSDLFMLSGAEEGDEIGDD